MNQIYLCSVADGPKRTPKPTKKKKESENVGAKIRKNKVRHPFHPGFVCWNASMVLISRQGLVSVANNNTNIFASRLWLLCFCLYWFFWPSINSVPDFLTQFLWSSGWPTKSDFFQIRWVHLLFRDFIFQDLSLQASRLTLSYWNKLVLREGVFNY